MVDYMEDTIHVRNLKILKTITF